MTDAFAARFSLFPNNNATSEKSPTQTGSIEISAAELPALIQWLQSATPENDYNNNPVVKLRIAGWDTESKGGRRYLSGRITPPMPPRDTNAQPNDSMPF